jgi:hypothetical protein
MARATGAPTTQVAVAPSGHLRTWLRDPTYSRTSIRCPMLQPDPTQADRLDTIITRLGEWITEARERGWHGEVEGLEVSLAAAHDKRQRMVRVTNLGMPIVSRSAGDP